MLGQPFQDRFTERQLKMNYGKNNTQIVGNTKNVEIQIQSRKGAAIDIRTRTINPTSTNIQKIGKNISDRTKRWLRILNIAMSCFHLVFFIITLTIGDISLNVHVFSMKLSSDTNFSHIPNFREIGGIPDNFDLNFLQPTVTRNNSVSLPITWLTSLFFLLSCLFHLGNALLWYNAYVYYLSIQRCPFRWIEYTFSASIMILVVAYAAGVVLETELLMIFILIATTMFFGHMTELISIQQSPEKWTLPFSQRVVPHILGYVPQISAWFVIIYTFVMNSEGAPDFVLATIIAEMILFFSFGVVQLVVLLRPPSKYVQGEIAYQILSLTSKGLLGIILFSNVIFLGNWQCIIDEVKSKMPESYC
jgi:hypothetical protein